MTNGERNRNGQFLRGHKGFGGRPVGARSKLSEKFLGDLEKVWKRKGAAALEKVAQEDPATLVRVCASLLPKELIAETANLNIDVSLFADAKNFSEAFRVAKQYLNINSNTPAMIEVSPEPDAEDNGISP